MNYLMLLLIVYVFLLLMSICMAKSNLLSPSVIFFGSFSVMLLLANMYNWYFEFSIKENTFLLMLAAGVLFLFGEYLTMASMNTVQNRRVYKDIRSDTYNLQNNNIPIRINGSIQNILIFFMMLAVTMAVIVVIRNTGDGSWTERMYQYKQLTRMDHANATNTMQFRFITSQLTRIAKAFVYIIGYAIIFNQVVCKISIKTQKRYVIICLLYIPLTLFQGVRQEAVEFVIFMLMAWFILRIYKKRIHLWGLAIRVIPLLVVFVWAFTAIAAGVGRANIERDPMIYVATYLCGGLKNFDVLIVDHPFSTQYFGQSTFSGLYSFLINKFHILPASADLSYHSFGFFGDTTVTTFGRWYEDFGAAGVLVMTFIVACFFSWLYNTAKSKKAPSLTHVIYIQQLMALVLASYDDRITYLMRPSNLILLLLFWIFYRLLIGGGRLRLSFRHKRIRLSNTVK